MIRKKYILILLSGLAAAFFSCAREDFSPGGGTGEIPDPEDFPQGYFTMNMDLSALKSTQTRSNIQSEPLWGRDEENYVSRVRMVLYGAKITGKDRYGNPVYDPDQQVVRYAFDFNIESEKDYVKVGWDWEGNPITEYKIVRYNQYYYDNGVKHSVPAGSDGWPATAGKPHLYKTNVEYNGEWYDYESALAGFTTWARRVMVDDYQMMLIINPTSSEFADGVGNPSLDLDLYKLTAVGQPLDEVWKAVNLSQSDLRNRSKYGFAEDNYFLMTNFQELVPVTKAQLMPTEQLANENPVPVTVSRAVSKITVTRFNKLGAVPARSRATDNDEPGDTTQILPEGASAEDFRFDLDATNKKSYWMREMTYMSIGEGIKGEMERWEDNVDRLGIYAEDPNFGSVADRNDHFSYLSHPYHTPDLCYYFKNEIPESGQGEDFAYCLENTMDDENSPYPTRFIDRSKDLTTVWISCKYAPPGMTAGESYYVWGSACIAPSAMKGFINAPGTIPPLPAFKGLAEAIKLASQGNVDLAPGHSFNKHGIKYYHDGVNYYSTVIIHSGKVKEDMVSGEYTPGYTYYGAVRNFHYEIFIRAIYGQGMPTIEDIPDSEKGNIEFEIRLNPWQERGQSVKPGNPVKPPVEPQVLP